MEPDHSRWPEFSHFSTLDFPHPFTNRRFRSVGAVWLIALPCCTAPQLWKESKAPSACQGAENGNASVLWSATAWAGTPYHFSCQGPSLKAEIVVCQVFWMLSLHQAVISVITVHKRDSEDYSMLSISYWTQCWSGEKEGWQICSPESETNIYLPFSLIFPPSFLYIFFFKQAASILSQAEFRLWLSCKTSPSVYSCI